MPHHTTTRNTSASTGESQLGPPSLSKRWDPNARPTLLKPTSLRARFLCFTWHSRQQTKDGQCMQRKRGPTTSRWQRSHRSGMSRAMKWRDRAAACGSLSVNGCQRQVGDGRGGRKSGRRARASVCRGQAGARRSTWEREGEGGSVTAVMPTLRWRLPPFRPFRGYELVFSGVRSICLPNYCSILGTVIFIVWC